MLDGKDAALERVASRVDKRQGKHITERVALTDGAEALHRLYGSPHTQLESLEEIALDSASQSTHEFAFPQTIGRQHSQSRAEAERIVA